MGQMRFDSVGGKFTNANFEGSDFTGADIGEAVLDGPIMKDVKGQGLEYDSVKIVITDANEDGITHSVFYTAVTRLRKHLRIFWTPETQQGILQRLHRNANSKDVALLASRRGLAPVSGKLQVRR